MFCLYTIFAISSLLIQLFSGSDTLSWHYTEDGRYTMKSSHHLAKAMYRVEAELTRNTHDSIWTKIWAVNSPLKCKNLVWRACLNSLLVCANLHQHHVNVDSLCLRCGCDVETIEHAFLTCSDSMKLWFSFHLSIWVDFNQITSFKEWLRLFVQHANVVAMSNLFNTIWCIWFSRNQLVFKGRVMKFQQTLTKANNQRLNAQDQAIYGKSHLTTWRGPTMNFVKINFDAYVRNQNGKGMGFVACNHEGTILEVATCFVETMYEPKIVEVLCYRWAICLAREFCFIGGTFETDCLQLFNCMKTTFSSYSSYFEGIVVDCKLLCREFQTHKFLFTKRGVIEWRMS
uniref:Ribonuclease H protein At1g65750 family n=1 Tax=Cajanus cajan TaxID=3821 RepID=A0A151SA97_CAJCA|nr:Putative ribonuclease H protein At1g65750 family [Cajanus cajan]